MSQIAGAVFLNITFFAVPLFAVDFFLVGADFLWLIAFFVLAASSLTETFLETLDFLPVVAAGLTVFTARALGLGAARVLTLPAGFLAGALGVVAFTLVVTAFGASFLEGGFVF